MKKILAILILNTICYSAYGKTFEHNNMRLDVNGYAGYKYITSSAQDTVNNSEPELGLALSLQLTDNLSAYTQFAYANDIETSLVYSFLSYDYLINPDFRVGIKAGKLRHEYGLYNSSRINPRTRQGVIMPQSIYWDSLRYRLASGVGINFNLRWKNLELSYTIDQPTVTDPQYEGLVWAPGLLNQVTSDFGSHQIASLKYSFSTIPLIFKASWTNNNLGSDNTKIHDIVFPDNNEQIMELLNLGVEYNYEKLTLSAEALLINTFFTEWDNFYSHGTSYTAKYEFSDKIDLRINYNYYYTPALQRNKWLQNTNDINIGINYHEDDWMIGAEVHQVNGARWTNPADQSRGQEEYDNWYIFAINAVYFF